MADEFTGTRYQLAGIETYTQYRETGGKDGQPKHGTFYMSGLKAVFTRAGEFPQLPRPASDMFRMDDPDYKRPEIHYLSAQELCEAILCTQDGISQHGFKNDGSKEAALKAIIDDMGEEKLRRALEVMTRIKPKDLSQTEGVQFIPAHRLIFR